MSCCTKSEPLAVSNFREYLRIPSVHPNINYDGCIEFLKKQADGLNLSFKVFELAPRKPVVVISWLGTNPELPSLLLNSHMDVVPVFEVEVQGMLNFKVAPDNLMEITSGSHVAELATLLQHIARICLLSTVPFEGAKILQKKLILLATLQIRC